MDGYLNKKQLKERGWTDSLIRRFLGEPDTTKPNPMYKSAAPMKLFSVSRVKKVELIDDFKDYKERVDRRSKSSKMAAEKRRRELIDELESVDNSLPNIPKDKLIKKAIEHYNYLMIEHTEGRGDLASINSDPDFLMRITVNYLRHSLSTYERQIANIFGRVGKGDGYRIIKTRILKVIGEIYPWLMVECNRQMGKLDYMK